VSFDSDERQSSIVSAALYAQTTTETFGHPARSRRENGASANT
jgi:hypothetical protein